MLRGDPPGSGSIYCGLSAVEQNHGDQAARQAQERRADAEDRQARRGDHEVITAGSGLCGSDAHGEFGLAADWAAEKPFGTGSAFHPKSWMSSRPSGAARERHRRRPR
jgi:hypothetical protein